MSLRDAAVEAASLHHDACMGEMLSVVQRNGRDIACTSGKTMNASHHHAFLFGRAGDAQIASQKKNTCRKETCNPVTFVCSRIVRAGQSVAVGPRRESAFIIQEGDSHKLLHLLRIKRKTIRTPEANGFRTSVLPNDTHVDRRRLLRLSGECGLALDADNDVCAVHFRFACVHLS